MTGGIFKYRTEKRFNEVKAPGGAKFLSAGMPDENDPPGMVGCWVWMFVPNHMFVPALRASTLFKD